MASWRARISGGRDELGLNDEELAHRVGVSLKTVQRWIYQGVEPRGKNREALAEVMGKTTAYRDQAEIAADEAAALFRAALDRNHPDALAPPERKPDPGILELLADTARCAALRLTETEMQFLREGGALGRGYVLRTADDAAEYILFIRRYKMLGDDH